jgi:hypothetical protein
MPVSALEKNAESSRSMAKMLKSRFSGNSFNERCSLYGVEAAILQKKVCWRNTP